jgi:phage N-6-adenine-methyltransferase
MSLVGFKAQNHPQQRAKDVVDNRAITWADFNPLHERFRFTIDAAATAENARLPRYWTKEDDALSQSWAGERVWCNPPYSNIREWVVKAWDAWEGAYDTEYPQLIVMLLPANRTEQVWWQRYVEPHRDGRGWPPGSPLRVEFLPGRMRFERPDAVIGPKGDRPPFGCCLLIWGRP